MSILSLEGCPSVIVGRLGVDLREALCHFLSSSICLLLHFRFFVLFPYFVFVCRVIFVRCL